MMGAYIFLTVFAVTIRFGFFIPTPLDESQRDEGYEEDGFAFVKNVWKLHKGLACYNGKGATDIRPILYDLDLYQCLQSCLTVQSCEGVVTLKSDARLKRPGICMLKKDIDLKICTINEAKFPSYYHNYDLHKKTLSSSLERESNGFCLPSEGHDHLDGIEWLKYGDKDACYHQCKAVPQATGCEWYKDFGCIYHTLRVTLDVVMGNGDSNHKCWVFNSSPTELKQAPLSYTPKIRNNYVDEIHCSINLVNGNNLQSDDIQPGQQWTNPQAVDVATEYVFCTAGGDDCKDYHDDKGTTNDDWLVVATHAQPPCKVKKPSDP